MLNVIVVYTGGTWDQFHADSVTVSEDGGAFEITTNRDGDGTRVTVDLRDIEIINIIPK